MTTPGRPRPRYRVVSALPRDRREVRPGDDLAKLIAARRAGAASTATSCWSPPRSSARPRAGSSQAADREAAIDAETVRVVARRGATADRREPAGPRDGRGRRRRLQHRLRHRAAAARGPRRLGPRRSATGCGTRSASRSASSSPTPSGGPGATGSPMSPSAPPGVRVLDDLRGGTDAHGNPLQRDRRRPPPTSWPPPATWSRARRPGCRSPSCAGWPTWSADGRRRRGAGDGARSRRDDMFRLGTSEAVREAVTPAPYGPGLHRRAGGPGRRTAGGRRGRHRARAAPHDAVAVRAAGVAEARGPAARRHAGRLDRGPAAATASREESDRQAGPARRRAAQRAVSGGAVPGDGRRRTPTATRGGTRPSARCSWSRRARACRTSWSRWPASGSARRGCRRRCSAGTWCARCWACRRAGTRWARWRWGGRLPHPLQRPVRPVDLFVEVR